LFFVLCSQAVSARVGAAPDALFSEARCRAAQLAAARAAGGALGGAPVGSLLEVTPAHMAAMQAPPPPPLPALLLGFS
jgi:hypothetical protein